MARVIYGGGVTEFIGSIGGSTFQSNNSGFIVRQLPKVGKKRTTLQANQNTIFSSLSQGYRKLDVTDKQSWIDLADAESHTDLWGKVSTVTGLNYYTIINTQFLQQGTNPVPSCPTYSAPVSSPAFDLIIGAGTLTIQTGATFGTTDEYMLLALFPPLNSANILPRKSAIIRTVLLDANISSLDISTVWESATGLNIVDDLNTPNNTTRVGVSLVNDNCPIPSPLVFNN